MSNRAIARIRVQGWLQALTPLHIGGLGGDTDSDLALCRDGAEHLVVPGTSLAGALRSWCERAGVPDISVLFGDQDGASRLVVEDGLIYASVPTEPGTEPGLIDADDPAYVEMRDGVGIDRVTGAAAPGVLYRRATVRAGVAIRLQLTVEARSEVELERYKEALGRLCDALAGGHVFLGAATTRGLGRVRLVSRGISVDRFDGAAGVLAAISSAWPAVEPFESAAGAGVAPSTVEFSVEWKPDGGFLVQAPIVGFAVDALPLVARHPETGGLVPVLPGASVKGALRSHAERILRTVLGVEAARDDEPNRFLRQLDADALPLVSHLFGAAPRARDDDPSIGRGALAVADCYASHPEITDTRWEALLVGSTDTKHDQLPPDIIKNLVKKGLLPTQHVAIDRWTGGAAEGLLFSVLELHDSNWEPLEIRLNLARLPVEHADAAVALTILVLRDFAAGWIPLGSQTTRGLGAITVTSIDVRGLPRGDTKVDAIPEDDLQRYAQAWTKYLEHARQTQGDAR